MSVGTVVAWAAVAKNIVNVVVNKNTQSVRKENGIIILSKEWLVLIIRNFLYIMINPYGHEQ